MYFKFITCFYIHDADEGISLQRFCRMRLQLNLKLILEGYVLEWKQLIFNPLSCPKQKKEANAFLFCDPAGMSNIY
jgi:hypothetical protein